MNGRAPNLPRFGSQVREKKKRAPSWWNAGHASLVVKKAINARMTRTPSPQASDKNRNEVSATARLLAFSGGAVSAGLGVMALTASALRRNDDLVDLGQGLRREVG